MATEVYVKQTASYNAFLDIAGHIHHHRIITEQCLPNSNSFNSGYLESGRLEIK
ncbi:hypothetical protein [Ferroplasma sp.]|uniref:hypothetical protein n=1 Tax=Ferroplasma sp. TaxID=2591003 RepID=UPI00307D9988